MLLIITWKENLRKYFITIQRDAWYPNAFDEFLLYKNFCALFLPKKNFIISCHGWKWKVLFLIRSVTFIIPILLFFGWVLSRYFIINGKFTFYGSSFEATFIVFYSFPTFSKATSKEDFVVGCVVIYLEIIQMYLKRLLYYYTFFTLFLVSY